MTKEGITKIISIFYIWNPINNNNIIIIIIITIIVVIIITKCFN